MALCGQCKNLPAEYLVFDDGTPSQFMLLCEHDMDELDQMNPMGEVESYSLMEPFDWEEFVNDQNQRMKYDDKRYISLLDKYSKRAGAEKLSDISSRLMKIAQEVSEA